MTPHERELILGVADQVWTADRSAIDPDAEQLIRTKVASQRNAAYLLTQRVIVQELALRQAQARIDELEGRTRPAGEGGPGRSFLGGAERQAPPAGGGAPQPGGVPPPAGGGGVGNFLKTAAAAAAGTIGGQLIYDGLRHLAAGQWGGPGAGGLLGETVSGGFLPGVEGSSVPDNPLEPPDQDRDWGGGGDFGADQSEAAEGDEYQNDEPDDAGDQDEWDDDDSDGSADDGGGGDW